MASTYLTRTFGSGNRRNFTLSMWVKLSGRGTGNNNALLVCGSSGGNEATISFSSDNLTWTEYTPGGGSVGYLSTSRKFRDYNAWYHLVFAWDTENVTANDRMKIYVNGVQETSFGGRTNPTLNYDSTLNTNIVHNIGRQTWNSSGLFNGSMSHIHFIDGTAYTPSAFGETDTTTGEWKAKTSPSVTYGTNGFFILKDGNGITDQSGEGNDFTLGGGTLTDLKDNPDNVFATFSNLVPRTSTGSAIIPNFSNGNLSASFPSSPNRNAPSTIAVSQGKYYAEFKPTNALSQNGTFYIGINCLEDYTNGFLGDQMYAYTDDGTKKTLGTYTSYGNSYANNDIIGIAFDATNGTVWFSKNGTWQNSATQSEIENGTTTNSAFSSLDTSKFWNITVTGYNETACSANFGNGYFGTTAVSSAGTNASGNGIFEYDVPTGYTALSTKGLNL